jgi:hypothetical protein
MLGDTKPPPPQQQAHSCGQNPASLPPTSVPPLQTQHNCWNVVWGDRVGNPLADKPKSATGNKRRHVYYSTLQQPESIAALSSQQPCKPALAGHDPLCTRVPNEKAGRAGPASADDHREAFRHSENAKAESGGAKPAAVERLVGLSAKHNSRCAGSRSGERTHSSRHLVLQKQGPAQHKQTCAARVLVHAGGGVVLDLQTLRTDAGGTTTNTMPTASDNTRSTHEPQHDEQQNMVIIG